MLVYREQVHVYVSKLPGRLNYETRTATKPGFSTIQDYVRYNVTNGAKALELNLRATPSIKRVTPKPVNKKKALPASPCGRCPLSSLLP